MTVELCESAPRLRFCGSLSELANSLNIVNHHVTLSHEENIAMASVVLLTDDSGE